MGIMIYTRKMIALVMACIGVMQLCAQQKLNLQFVNMVGESKLNIGDSYKTSFDEPFTVRRFKYYISNIQLQDDHQQWHKVSSECFLVDAEDPASQAITVNHGLKNIKSIKFLLGVDSIKNVSGVQTGTLDPARGMFWTWNSGYIVAKLEGKSSVSKALGRYMTYDVGGYKPGENASRWIVLPLTPATKNKPLQAISIKADVLAWFKGENKILIAENAVCHEPGILAMKLADNYSHMFSILQKQ
ncbi:hypothetical protein QTN47_09855 [Danxiaibacter flavus]|uniref:Copper-binding protein MbnP-like domain-containing protein n=1 Tax=Danxiaibacter flavus TaxID=3049108 RepID=A0ABV3ZH21_9BACT|nr:hypothetical protein QNM32_09855 [Chitinophagaceae bacterium DXS]